MGVECAMMTSEPLKTPADPTPAIARFYKPLVFHVLTDPNIERAPIYLGNVCVIDHFGEKRKAKRKGKLTPMIKPVELGAAPQTTDPTSKTNKAARKTHFGFNTL